MQNAHGDIGKKELADRTGLFLATWKKIKGKYFIWLCDDMTVHVSDRDFEKATERMCGILDKKYGSSFEALDFVRAKPQGAWPWPVLRPEYLTVGEDTCIEPTNDLDLREGEICKECSFFHGKRNQIMAEYNSIPDNVHHFFGWNGGNVYSAEFLNLLPSTEHLALRPVKITKGTRSFFELLAPAALDKVGMEGFPGLTFNTCELGGFKDWVYHTEDGMFFLFGKSDLPSPYPVAISYDSNCPTLLVEGWFWRSIHELPETRNMNARRVGAVPDNLLIRDPTSCSAVPCDPPQSLKKSEFKKEKHPVEPYETEVPEESAKIHEDRSVVMHAEHDDVYLANWKKIRGKYHVWLKDDETVCASDTNFEEACIELSEMVIGKFGSCSAVLDFVRPKPKGSWPSSVLNPEYLLIGSCEAIRPINPISDLIEGMFCKECCIYRGKRSDVIAEYQSVPKRVHVFGSMAISNVFSSEFLSLIPSTNHLTLRPVKVKTGKRTFFELVGPATLEEVGMKSFEGFSLNSCKSCGYSGWCYYKNRKLFRFISKSDLLNLPESKIISCDSDYPSILIEGRAWRSIQGKSVTKNLTADRVGTVMDEDLIRDPVAYYSELKEET